MNCRGYVERKIDYGDSRMIAAKRKYIRAIDELCAREAFRSCQSIPDFDGGDHEAAFEDGGDREASFEDGGDSRVSFEYGGDHRDSFEDGGDHEVSSEDLYFEDAISSEDGGDHTAIEDGGDHEASSQDGGDHEVSSQDGGDQRAMADGGDRRTIADGGDQRAIANDGGLFVRLRRRAFELLVKFIRSCAWTLVATFVKEIAITLFWKSIEIQKAIN